LCNKINFNDPLQVKKLKIGILGSQGIPNHYGGFEQCAEYLALGLSRKGHEVWVYNRHNHECSEDTWNGVNIIHCRNPDRILGAIGQFVYDYLCLKDAGKRSFDILLQLGYTSSSVWYRMWPRDCTNIVNMDGMEWKRTKYNEYVKQFLKYAEKWAVKHADLLIADSPVIKNYLENRYGKSAVFIPYGAEIFDDPDVNIIREYRLEPFGYHLLIARLVPENNIEMIIKGIIAARSAKPLVIIGNTDNRFGLALKRKYAQNDHIRFLGGIYDKHVTNDLRYYSSIYFHGHTVGGTNPSLLEAMACSSLIAAHNNAFNKTVLGDDAFYFRDTDQIANIINTVGDKSGYSQRLNNNIAKINTCYNWPNITDEYEKVFFDAIAMNKTGDAPHP